MFVKFYLFYFLILLLTNNGDTQGIISIAPADPFYWLDSSIKVTCRTSFNTKVEECSWFINNKRISNGQIYQFSVDEKLRECAIVVKTAATAENGKWKCRLHPSTAGLPEMSASTNVTILDLSLRECAVIVCGTLVMLAMSLAILCLAVKNRRAKFVAQRRSYLASAPVNLENGFNGIGTPPPSYDTAVSGRILAEELACLGFSRCHNEMEGHSSLQSCQDEDFEPTLKTRSAPTLIITP